MSKERLKELLDGLPYTIRHSSELEPLKQFAREQAERVQELEEENRFQMSETHKNLDKSICLGKENQRYKQALEQVEGFLVKANKFMSIIVILQLITILMKPLRLLRS